jgi:acyl carrier protein
MKILIYNSGGGLGDSIQLFDLITTLKEKFGLIIFITYLPTKITLMEH